MWCVCHCIRNCLFFRLNGLRSIVAVIFVSFGRCNLCVRCLRCHQHLLHHQLRWINVINEPSNPKRIIRPICVDNEFIHWFGCFCSMSSEFAIHWTSMYWFLSCIEWTTKTRTRTMTIATTLHHLVTFAYQFQLLFCDIRYWNRTWIFSMLRSIADAIAKQSVLFVLVDDFFPHCKHDEVHLWWLLCHFNAQHNEHLNEDMHKDGLVSLWFFLSILLHWKQKNRQFVCWNVRWRETFRLYWWIIVMIVGKNRIVFRHRNEKAIFIERPRCLGVTEVN